ncbi:MAG: hypothetical protein ACOX7D_03060 [Alphaproteobacteria bacterium]|jgi:hypothetical protein
MSIKQKTADNKIKTSNLSEWLFVAPLKFTGLFSVLTIILLTLMNLFFTNQYFQVIKIISIIAMLAIFVFSTYKIIRWTSDDKLNHKSFIMLNTAQNILSVILILIIGFLSILLPRIVTNFNMAVILTIFIGMLTIFLIGNGLLKIKSLFCRARNQNVPKWKLWLSMPLGINLFWYSGFLLPDNKKTSDTIKTKFKAFDELTNWIVRKPSNTILTFLIFITFGGVMITTGIKTIIIFYAASLLMLIILMWKKLRNNISGLFSTGIIILNIVAVIGILITLTYLPKQTQIIGEQIEITEVNKQ